MDCLLVGTTRSAKEARGSRDPQLWRALTPRISARPGPQARAGPGSKTRCPQPSIPFAARLAPLGTPAASRASDPRGGGEGTCVSPDQSLFLLFFCGPGQRRDTAGLEASRARGPTRSARAAAEGSARPRPEGRFSLVLFWFLIFCCCCCWERNERAGAGNICLGVISVPWNNNNVLAFFLPLCVGGGRKVKTPEKGRLGIERWEPGESLVLPGAADQYSARGSILNPWLSCWKAPSRKCLLHPTPILKTKPTPKHLSP